MLLENLISKQLIQPPKFLVFNTMYLTRMGSEAYGVSNASSDVDIYGLCIPPKNILFPWLEGWIPGFGRQPDKFEQYQQHHVQDKESDKEYDLSIYSIVKYFQLCMECNPNIVDSLFTPQRCVIHCTAVGNLIRQNRKMFLHKGAYYKFLGYAHSQLHKMSSQNRTGKRKEVFDTHGYDLKFAYHLVRLAYEAQQILEEGDLDLERNREHLKAIRRGEIKEQEVRDWFSEKEKYLEKLYETSKLPNRPDEDKIRALLLECLEHHYGSLEGAVVNQDALKVSLRNIRDELNKVDSLL